MSPSKPASEQDVRDAAISALRLSRTTLALSTVISLLSVYLSVAVGNHWWPWLQDQALERAKRVSSYSMSSFEAGSGKEPTRVTVSVTIVNNSDAPARDVLLHIRTRGDEFHDEIGSTPVGLADIEPCHAEHYQVTVDVAPDTGPDSSMWTIQYRLDGESWQMPLGGAATRHPYAYPVETFGIGGDLGGTKGWSADSNSISPSSGPGCG